MDRKLIITKLKENILTLLMENEIVTELHCYEAESGADRTLLGNIYVGRVKNIVANINAAFIEIANGVECYYAIGENPTPIFTKKTGKKSLCIGDEFLVQVSKEAVKTKAPTVTSKLNFTGKYAVLTYGDCRISASSKLPKDVKTRLTGIASQYVSKEYGIIMRTNAGDVEANVLEEEIQRLIREYKNVTAYADTRTCFSCLQSAPKQYLLELRNVYQNGTTEIIIEEQSIYDEVIAFIEKEQPEDLGKVRKYEDALLPLHKLFSIEKILEDVLKERVWMKSGAYLVIEPTEALTVIDVNTGKCISRKKDDDTSFKINKEAAQAAARQIRLRNLSGIILIDFINMDKKEYMDELMEYLEWELKKDPIATTLVDITKLQLVEITRKKVRRPLHEIIKRKEE